MYTFEEIYGNELIIRSMQKAAASGRVHQAYVISGSPGCGKSLLAKTFAKTLQCDKRGVTPCNACVSCKTFDSMNHPDVLYVAPVKTKALGVDDIRTQVNLPMEVRPLRYPYKIFILEDSDAMTPAAQNALLKTIEEPAGYGVFLFTAKNTELFLPTLLSRVIQYKIKPLADSKVYDYLTSKATFTPEEAGRCSAYARGSIGQALRLKNDEGFIAMKEMAAVLVHKGFHLSGELFQFTKELEPFKDRIHELLDLLFIWYRDLWVYKTCGQKEYIMEKDWLDEIQKAASGVTARGLEQKLRAVQEAKAGILRNASFTMVMDILLMALAGEGGQTSLL